MRNIKRFFVGDVRYAYWIRTSRPAHGKYSRVGTYGTRYLGTFSGYMWSRLTHGKATDCVKHCAVGISKLLAMRFGFTKRSQDTVLHTFLTIFSLIMRAISVPRGFSDKRL